jgi:rare lipoprotein A
VAIVHRRPIRITIALVAVAALAACAGKSTRPAAEPGSRLVGKSPAGVHTAPANRRAPPALREGSAPWSERDRGPPEPVDTSDVPDAVPVAEPLAAYGNHSPYTVLGRTYHVLPSAKGYRERGYASWYGKKFHGRRTSMREPYDMYAMTAAHKTLPLPSYARVTNLDNGRSVVVRINDRGPFVDGRIIDLSYAAAARIGILGAGTGRVEVETIVPRGMHATVAPREAPAPAIAGSPSSEATVPQPSRAAPSAPPGERPARAPAASPGRTTLQAGAFGSRENAERLAGEIRRNAIDPVRVERDRRLTGTIWRVRIGPLADAETTAQVERRLRALGIQAIPVNVGD